MNEDVPDRPDSCAASPTLLDARCEAALARLVRALRSEATHVALVGPAAAGKTTLLRELPQRLGRSFACAYISQPCLGPEEIRAWIESFDRPLPADAGTTLEDLAYAHARRGAGLTLLIDDANGMPLEVARALDPLVARTDRALRLVLAGLADARLEAVLACFDTPFETIALELPDPGDAVVAHAIARRTQSFATPRDETPAIVDASPAILDPGGAARNARAFAWRASDRVSSARARIRSLLPGQPPRIPKVAAVIAAIALAFWAGRWSASSTSESVPSPGASATLPPVAAAPPGSAEAVPVHVNARPWARVSVDGREIGITPLGNVLLEPGLRRFRAELPDGRVIERDVEISEVNRRVTFP